MATMVTKKSVKGIATSKYIHTPKQNKHLNLKSEIACLKLPKKQ